MKKLISTLLVVVLSVCLIACSGGNVNTTEPTPDGNTNSVTLSVKSIEELDLLVEKDVEDTVALLQKDFADLTEEITNYDQYVQNIDKVKAFYDKIIQQNEAVCIRLREYSVDYVQLIMNSNMTMDEREDALDDTFESIYEDAEEDLYDGIYEGVMEDMFGYFYDGILSDGYDFDIYEEWLDIQSDEYDMYLETSSEVFDCILDMSSDVLDFWLDVSAHVWEDVEDVYDEITDFEEDIKELKEHK
ncbi:MAG: hypothetical protein IKU53_05150 [Firmicutes bacterium]|nr:hypothetical protein [Bacillota bacterium]